MRSVHFVEKKIVFMNGRKMDFYDIDNELVTLSSELIDIDKQHTMTMKELKESYARKIYFECDQNLTKASRLLAISSRSLKNCIDGDKISVQQES